jgi:hypothetical protein
MTVPAVPEMCGVCGVEIPPGLEVFAMPTFEETDSPEAPLDGPILAMCRDCAELNDQLDQGLED